MPHIFPGAAWRPMPGQERRPKRRKGRGVGFHIAVYEGPSIYDINLRTGNDAHLYVRRDGTVEQNIDLDLQAWAGGAGNASMLWVETQGGTTAADVKSGRWAPPQAETLARIAAYAHRTEGTPLDLMPDSRPASRGLATHRLGIKHSRGIGTVPGFLVSGGELWSSAVGKECPGDARVAQMPEVSARAKRIVAELMGGTQPQAAPPSPARHVIVQEDPMQLKTGEPALMTVPYVPPGHKAVLTATGDSVTGSLVYGKGTRGDKTAHPLFRESDAGWRKYLGVGYQAVEDVTWFTSVSLINHGTTENPEALASAVITVVPA